LEGNGLVFLGSFNLTIGGNDLSTEFSGIVQDGGYAAGSGGSLTKLGAGNLTLTGANTYTGGTVVQSGVLLANNSSGSGTGSGPVTVSAGTFGGGGAVSGNVVVGTGNGSGAILAPGPRGVTPGRFTIRRKLTLKADASYVVLFDSSVPASDQVRCKGVGIRGAQIQFSDRASRVLTPGTAFTVIDNRAAGPISGTFSNLADGATVNIGPNTFQANYEGGDGNDLTLTVTQ
jgi:autotransporter-associated beta strand protein